MPICAESSSRLESPAWPSRRRAPEPLDGGITNRNYRARFGGADYVIRVPGKDTVAARDRPRAPSGSPTSARPRPGSRRRSRRCSTTRQASSPCSSRARGMSAEELREPAALADVARSLRAIHELGEPLPTTLRLLPDRRDLRRDRARRAARRCPTPTREAHARARRGSRRRSTGPEHEPVPCHNDLLAANFIAGAASGSGSSTGSTPGWATATSTSPTSPSTTSSARRREEALLAELLRRAGRPRRRLAALRLMRFMSDFREAMWGVVQAVVSELDFDFADYAEQPLRPPARDRRRPALRRAGSRRRVSPRAELPDSARCVIIGGGVGGASIAYHLAKLGYRDVVLVDRAELTSGSTFHSAGLVGQLRGSVSLTKMMMHSVEVYRGLADRVRARPRLGRVRRHPARLERGADGGAAPPGGLGEDVRPAAGADLRRRGEGDVPADVDRRRPRRRLAADRRLHRPLAAHLRARRRRPPRGRPAGVPEHPGDRDRGRRRAGARGRDREGPDRGRGGRQRRRHVRGRDRADGRGPRAGDPDRRTSTWSRSRSASTPPTSACRPCATPTCSSTSARTAAAW